MRADAIVLVYRDEHGEARVKYSDRMTKPEVAWLLEAAIEALGEKQ